MGVLLQIRDVPEDVHRALKSRAAAAGVSLSEYVLGVPGRTASRPTPALRARGGDLRRAGGAAGRGACHKGGLVGGGAPEARPGGGGGAEHTRGTGWLRVGPPGAHPAARCGWAKVRSSRGHPPAEARAMT